MPRVRRRLQLCGPVLLTCMSFRYAAPMRSRSYLRCGGRTLYQQCRLLWQSLQCEHLRGCPARRVSARGRALRGRRRLLWRTLRSDGREHPLLAPRRMPRRRRSVCLQRRLLLADVWPRRPGRQRLHPRTSVRRPRPFVPRAGRRSVRVGRGVLLGAVHSWNRRRAALCDAHLRRPVHGVRPGSRLLLRHVRERQRRLLSLPAVTTEACGSAFSRSAEGGEFIPEPHRGRRATSSCAAVDIRLPGANGVPSSRAVDHDRVGRLRCAPYGDRCRPKQRGRECGSTRRIALR